MNNSFKSFILFAFAVIILSGCASAHMTVVPPGQVVSKPSAGKALIVFVRPSSFGGAIQSSLYDGDTYIGTLSAKKQIAYEADPGERLFMVVGESADFLRATLEADKTYYAVVAVRPGFWKARFSFKPQNGQIPQEKMQAWLAGTKQVSVNERGRAWAETNAPSIAAKKAGNLPKWEAKPEDKKQILHADSGR